MNNIPEHIGIILDGNRRWAKQKNIPAIEGHRKGFNNIKKIGDYAWKKGIKFLTVFGFSTENWSRPSAEINYLMELFKLALNEKSIKDYHKKGIRIQIIGQKQKFSKSLRQKIKKAEKITENNKNRVLTLALSYGGRPEITEAVKNIIEKKIPAHKITEDLISQNLWTKDIPEPDLIIRTGGHNRLSGFLIWQSAYSELYFLDKYWPDFDEDDLDNALDYYKKCRRNFGK